MLCATQSPSEVSANLVRHAELVSASTSLDAGGDMDLNQVQGDSANLSDRQL
jgi:hypothetical protein